MLQHGTSMFGRTLTLAALLAMVCAACGSSEDSSSAVGSQAPLNPATDNTAKLGAGGMYCEECPRTVRAALDRVGGVRRFEADLSAQTVTVGYERVPGRLEAYVKAIEGAGYRSGIIDSGQP